MQALTHLKSILGKAIFAALTLGGVFLFAGAPGAEARPAVRREVVVHGYYGRRVEYRRFPRREFYAHGWRDRFGCWHRY